MPRFTLGSQVAESPNGEFVRVEDAERIQWRLDYLMSRRNDPKAAAIAFYASDSEVDKLRNSER